MTLLSKNARVAGFLYILASVVGVVRLMYIPNVLFGERERDSDSRQCGGA